MTPEHLSLDPQVRVAVARKPETPKNILQTLAQDPSVVVRQYVLRAALHREDIELLEIFLFEPDPVLRAELALSPDCPEEILRRCKQDPNPAIRGIIEHRIGAAPVAMPEVEEAEPEPIVEKAPEKLPEPLPEPPVQAKVPEPVKEEIPEQDEPTGGVNGTSRLAPIKVEEPVRPNPVPVRTPMVINRPTPLPVRNPINPGLVRPAPKPFAPVQPAHAAPVPVPMPTPMPAPPMPIAPQMPPTPPPVHSAPLAETLPAEEPIPIVAPKAASPLPENGQIRIQLTASDKSVSELSFNQDLLVVGRVIGNDIVLPHGNVSKNHCRIFVIDGQLYIEDLKSTNGTQLNKTNITPREPHILMPSDEVGIGSSTLKITVSY